VYNTDNDGANLVLLMTWLPVPISLLFNIPTIHIMRRVLQTLSQIPAPTSTAKTSDLPPPVNLLPPRSSSCGGLEATLLIIA
jgi:hypothetical protein